MQHNHGSLQGGGGCSPLPLSHRGNPLPKPRGTFALALASAQGQPQPCGVFPLALTKGQPKPEPQTQPQPEPQTQPQPNAAAVSGSTVKETGFCGCGLGVDSAGQPVVQQPTRRALCPNAGCCPTMLACRFPATPAGQNVYTVPASLVATPPAIQNGSFVWYRNVTAVSMDMKYLSALVMRCATAPGWLC